MRTGEPQASPALCCAALGVVVGMGEVCRRFACLQPASLPRADLLCDGTVPWAGVRSAAYCFPAPNCPPTHSFSSRLITASKSLTQIPLRPALGLILLCLPRPAPAGWEGVHQWDAATSADEQGGGRAFPELLVLTQEPQAFPWCWH